MSYLGDMKEDQAFNFKFTTRQFSTGSPFALSGGVLSVYKDNGLTQTTTGPTLTADFDSVTGLNNVVMDTTDAFYVTGSDYEVVITTGTVDSVSVVGEVVASFSIENRSVEDVRSDLVIVKSDTLAIEAKASDTHSRLVVVESSIDSDQTSRATVLGNIDSQLTVTDGVVDQNYSRLQVVEASVDSDQVSRTTAISDVKSQLAIVRSETAVIQSDSIIVESSVQAAESQVVDVLARTQYARYAGPRGPGIYLNDASGVTGTTFGTHGTVNNPVDNIANAKTLADGQSIDRIYLVNDSAITLAATMTDYEFVGIGAPSGNTIALASQDVSNSAFYNVTITGIQAGTGRARFEDCIFGVATLHLYALRCGLSDSAGSGLTLSNNDDNILDGCFSMVAGNAAPVLTCTGAANLDLSIRHYSGGLSFVGLNATATASIEGHGQIIVDATSSISTTLTVRGHFSITDNTAGLNNLTIEANWNQHSQLSQIHSDVIAADIVSMASSVEAIEVAGGALTGAQDSKLTQVHSESTVIESSVQAIEVAGGALTGAQDSKLTQVHSESTVIESSVQAIEAAGGALTAGQDSKLTQVHSESAVIEAKTSDTHSRLLLVEASVDSDQTSRATALANIDSQVTATDSQLTVTDTVIDQNYSRLQVVEAAIDSDQVVNDGALTNIDSQVTATDSQLTVTDAAVDQAYSRLQVVEAAIDSDQTSRATALANIDSQATATDSQLTVTDAVVDQNYSRLQVVEAAVDSDQASRVIALSDIKSDVVALQDGYVESTTKAGTLSTTQCSTNLTEATADHYKGVLIVFMDGALAGQRSDVTAYVGTNGVLTFTALTEAPGAGDTFRLY